MTDNKIISKLIDGLHATAETLAELKIELRVLRETATSLQETVHLGAPSQRPLTTKVEMLEERISLLSKNLEDFIEKEKVEDEKRAERSAKLIKSIATVSIPPILGGIYYVLKFLIDNGGL